MRTSILKRASQAFAPSPSVRQSWGVIAMAVTLAASNLSAAPIVNWFSGGPNNGFPSGAGYADGNTILDAEYHTPCGLAIDSTGNFLFVADRDNNVIRYLDIAQNQTWTFGITTPSLINKPISVAVDSFFNVYVLNRGNGLNGSVLTFDNWGDLLVTNATGLTNAPTGTIDSPA